jgi:iron complex outermembrane receptor protein
MYSNMKTNSYAAFAQGTYEITPTTNATLGIRYTYDTRSIEGQRYAAAGNAQPEGTLLLTTDTLPESQTHRNFGKVTWRFALDQRINDNAMLFGSVSRGFKSGVFSVSSPFNPAASPETLDAYEVGLKSDLLDRTLRLNLSAFYYDYKNIQLQANFTGTTSLINAAAGKSKGLEAEVIVAPRLTTGNLELRSSISFLDANYRSFPGGLILTPRATGGNAQTFGDLSGSTFINAPRFTSSVSLNYDAPIFGDYKAGFGVTWYHNGGFYWDVQNRVREPSYDLVSGNIFIALPDDRARLRLYARNLFDKRYYAYVSVSTAGDLGLPAAPRTIGVALDFKF